MTLDELKESVNALTNSQQLSAELYFLLQVGEEQEVKRVDVEANAMEALCTDLKVALQAKLMEENLALLDLSTADERKSVVYRYDLDDAPPEFGALGEVLATDNFEVFDFDQDSLASIKALLIVLGDGNNHISLYKHHYPVSLLRKEGFSLKRLQNSNRLVRLDGDVLKINSDFDYMQMALRYLYFT